MAFREIKEKLEKKAGYPKALGKRFRDLDAFDRLLDGTFYEHIDHPFEKDTDGMGHYVRLNERRPAIIYNLPSIIEEDCAALIFGDDHCPSIRCREKDPKKLKFEATQAAIDELLSDETFFERMMQGVNDAFTGSAVAIVYADPDGNAWFEFTRGKYCTPVFDGKYERKLKGVIRVYDVSGTALEGYGYAIPPDKLDKTWWMRVDTDEVAHHWYQPLADDEFMRLGQKREDGSTIEWVYDPKRSSEHGFDCTPAVWIKTPGGDRVDGQCVFKKIVDACVKLDYLLSQVCRGTEYTADPTLVIKDGNLGSAAALQSSGAGDTPTTAEGNPVRDIMAPLQLGKDGDAKLLEITGGGMQVALELLKRIREWAMEVVGGNKADQDHSTQAPQSGRALEVLYSGLVWLVERLRKPFGTKGAVEILRVILRGAKAGVVKLEAPMDGVDPDAPIECHFPDWNKPRGQDLLNEMKALQIASGASDQVPKRLLPMELIAALAVGMVGHTDVSGAIRKLEADIEDDRQKALQQLQDETDIQTASSIEIEKSKPAPVAPAGGAKK